VRVIIDGRNLGVVPTEDALALAKQQNLDLVEVSPKNNPPVCHIIDFAKFSFEQKKAEKKNQAKQKQNQIDWKEIRLTPGICQNDIDHKVRQLRAFLEEGKHVRVAVHYKKKQKRQLAHIDDWGKILDGIVEAVKDIGKTDRNPSKEGIQMVVQITPIVPE
jgi:translation initiation factor IF-3